MKNVIFLGIGLVFGAGIGVLATRGHYRKIALDEISEVRDIYRKKAFAKEKADKNSEMKGNFLQERDILSEKSSENAQNGEKKLVKLTENEENGNFRESKIEELKEFHRIREPYVHNYNIFSNPFDDDLVEDDEYDDDDPYELSIDHDYPRDGYSEPFLISEEEFSSEKLFYDKVIINYYSDGIGVLDDTDEIVEQIEELVGPDILTDKSVRIKAQDDTIYVRNDNRSTDYGIIFLDSKFMQEEEPD